jgi:hypothetical protein
MTLEINSVDANAPEKDSQHNADKNNKNKPVQQCLSVYRIEAEVDSHILAAMKIQCSCPYDLSFIISLK